MKLDEVIHFNELPDNELTVIPAGWYVASITEATVKLTKRGDGQYLSVRYTVLGPAYQGRSVYGNVTLRNTNETAIKIGRAQLKELMGAIGLAQLSDTDQLVGATLQIRVAVKDDEQYGQSNDVRGWKPAGAQPPVVSPVTSQTSHTTSQYIPVMPPPVVPSPQVAPRPQPQPQPRSSNLPPWA